MITRLATKHDIPELTILYKAIIKDMNNNGYMFWTEDYPLNNIINDTYDNKVYIVTKDNIIISCFTLNENNPGNNHVTWIDNSVTYLYIDRLGVNVNYKRQGIASLTLKEAIRITKEANRDYLRLFVAATNKPAIGLYASNGFKIAEGVFNDTVNGIYLEELGIEIKT